VKKLVCLILLFVFISANATETRVRGLGSIGNYIDDDSNIYIFPGRLSFYQNLSILEMNTSSSTGSALVTYHNAEKNLDIGLVVNRPTSIYYFDYDNYPRTNSSTLNRLLIGKNNKVFFVGADYDYSDAKDISYWGDRQTSNLNTQVGFGLTTQSEKPLDFSCVVNYSIIGKESRNNDYDPSRHTTDSGKIINPELRLRYSKDSFIGKIRPYIYLSAKYGELDTKEGNSEGIISNDILLSAIDAEFGFVYEKKINPRTDLWVGLIPASYSYGLIEGNEIFNSYSDPSTTLRYSTDEIEKYFSSSFFFAAESKLKNWFTARASFRSWFPFTHSEVVSGNDALTSTYNAMFDHYYEVNYGFSVYHKGFAMDCTFNPEILYNGPNVITGQHTSQLVSHISVLYQW